MRDLAHARTDEEQDDPPGDHLHGDTEQGRGGLPGVTGENGATGPQDQVRAIGSAIAGAVIFIPLIVHQIKILL